MMTLNNDLKFRNFRRGLDFEDLMFDVQSHRYKFNKHQAAKAKLKLKIKRNKQYGK